MIALLHLTDIHIDSGHHPILSRVDRIARAALSTGHDITHILIVVSGDIAQSGKAAEYAAADSFFRGIAAALKVSVSYVFVPGNHDCDLTTASDVRQLDIIEPKLSSLDLGGDLARHFLDVQREFFQFTSRFEGQHYIDTKRQLCHRRIIVTPEGNFCFNCFNTSWLTQNPERPARLYFPLGALDSLGDEVDCTVRVSIFHHPFNWLNPNNAQAFKHAVEGLSDIMFTGHEHSGDIYSKRRTGEEIIHFVEGDALWEPKSRDSAFNLVLLNLADRRYQTIHFRWVEGQYYPRPATPWAEFLSNRAAHRDAFINNSTFLKKLNELGTGFSHRNYLSELTLRDVFVYPELRKRLMQAQLEGKRPASIRSAAILDLVKKHQKVLITGESAAGKTCLARILYTDLQRDSLVPIIVEGRFLRGDDAKLLEIIYQAYSDQYTVDSLETFKQLDPSKRVIIVDDLHKGKLDLNQQGRLVRLLERLAETVVLFVDESVLQLEEITDKEIVHAPFATYQQFSIQPFCPSLRTQLIRRWVELGITEDMTEDDISQEIKDRERVLSTFLSDQSLPPLPIFVLGLLQAYEANINLNTANGSYGELYESLITERLRRISKKPIEISTKYALLARLAYFLYRNERSAVGTQDLDDIRRAYFTEFDIDIDVKSVIADLVHGELLSISDGNFKFKYPSYYYFFLAKYLKESLGEASEAHETRRIVRDLADHLHFEPYVNILIFYLYFSRDTEAIEYLLDNAKHIYQRYDVCKLDDEVEFLNKLNMGTAKPILIADSDLRKGRAHHDQVLDDTEVNARLIVADDKDRDITYSDGLNDVIKMNIAFKTLQVLGQVLRNFPNVLRADLKTRVTQECYWLGLRILNAILSVSHHNLEELREYFAILIREQREITSEHDLASATDGFLVRIVGACAFSVIKRVSRAVGSEELGETYKNVFRLDDGKTSVALIDLSIKLDHFKSFPLSELEALYRKIQHNWFTYTLLRDMIIDHLVLFDVGHDTRRQISKILLIEVGERKSAGVMLLE